MEKAIWINWRDVTKNVMELSLPDAEQRVYFGHETCRHLLPTISILPRIVPWLKESGRKMTFVVPFLTEAELLPIQHLIEKMSTSLDGLEVVSSDWGILYWLCHDKLAEPIIGRLLTAQWTDPRIKRVLEPDEESTPTRWVQHLDGTHCLIKKQQPSSALASHYRRSWVDRPYLIQFLQSLGIRRCEISNLGQGLELDNVPGWTYSLWLPDVLTAVMERCPGAEENFNSPSDCLKRFHCGSEIVEWQLSSFPVKVFRSANAIYYQNQEMPAKIELLPIDRIVTTILKRTLI